MSDEVQGTGEALKQDGPTAEQIKAQILERQRELKVRKAVSTPPPQPEPSVSQPAPAPVQAPAATVEDKPASQPEISSGGVTPAPASAGKDGTQDWMKKKGFKSVEDMARSLRELERELTRSRQEKHKEAPVPPPVYQYPPQYPMQPAPSEEDIARRYNLDPDDLRRVGPLIADMTDAKVERKIASTVMPLHTEVKALQRELARERDFQTVREDPLFKNPRVQHEMHQILEQNPSILEIEPAPWRYAFNEALRSLGRRIVEGSIEPEDTPAVSGTAPYPTTPPKTAGGGGQVVAGGPGIAPPNPLDPQKFSRMPAEDMKKVLEQMGARKPDL